jgi:hypothetical protein
MCQRVQCAQCGRPTFAGCGRHIESVLSDVPVAQRCRCRAEKAAAAASSKDASQTGAGQSIAASITRLFGRAP